MTDIGSTRQLSPGRSAPARNVSSSQASSSSRALDEQTFESLYQAQWGPVYSFFCFRSGPAEAQDLAAEAFTRVWSARSDYDSARGSPEQWLWAIARNVASDWGRRARREAAIPGDVTASVDVEAEGMSAAQVSKLNHAMTRLELIDREILALRFGGGQQHRAIGEVLGLAEGTVAVRLHRAIRRLRTYLDGGSA